MYTTTVLFPVVALCKQLLSIFYMQQVSMLNFTEVKSYFSRFISMHSKIDTTNGDTRTRLADSKSKHGGESAQLLD